MYMKFTKKRKNKGKTGLKSKYVCPLNYSSNTLNTSNCHELAVCKCKTQRSLLYCRLNDVTEYNTRLGMINRDTRKHRETHTAPGMRH